MLEHTFAVIMAGGSGTRFWPASRLAKPKQLLPLVAPISMLQSTLTHCRALVPNERILIVTNERLAAATLAESQLPAENILLEPVGRNTAPCLAWAAEVARARDPNAIMAVFAADHFIGSPEQYQRVLERGVELANQGHLVTVGITPTRPETGYGYLELGATIVGRDGAVPARNLIRFVEKPNAERAVEFVLSRNYAWNSGQFFFSAERLLGEVKTHMPTLHDVMQAIVASGFSQEAVRTHFPHAPNVSIDTGIMEKAADLVSVEGNFGWSDVGSWFTAWELAEKDTQGNRSGQDSHIYVNARDCFIDAPKDKAVCLVGVEGLIVVDTGDALLVMPKDRAQEVKTATAELKVRGLERFL